MIGRLAITDVRPVVSCRQWPAKAVVGETVTVWATVFREGHDAVSANVAAAAPDGTPRPFTRMRLVAPGTDRWEGEFDVDAQGLWTFVVEAWGDPLATWRHDAEIKVPLGQDLDLVFEEGARLLERAARAVPAERRDEVFWAAGMVRDADGLATPAERLAAATAPRLLSLLERHPLRELLTTSPRHELWVDRPRALFGAWYEFFPRSEGASRDPPRSGTFRTAMERLPAIQAMGFDVVYLPPIHPIGDSFRKGRNNTLTPQPGDPGSPWAIGSAAGGHDAIHPDLGTLEDFDAFVARTRELGMEVAIDFALQASPDHPWAKEHPEWFTVRADGTIAYAENPPKKYQDIYPVNFDRDPEGIYAECLRVLRYWMDHGVRIFRVDNPHTKPLNFWEWLLGEVRKTDPDVLFLAEAFTRPPMMHTLAKIGFTQSYTYFTWRTQKWELEEYFRELSGEAADYMRPNLFVNTPDILHAYLQYGGPPAFRIRALLAALLSPTWGVYSGYELFEHTAVRPGSEEYLDSEKYQYRPRDWAAAERKGRSLAPYLTMLNDIRRSHPALHWLRNLRFHAVDGDEIMAFSKRLPPRPLDVAAGLPTSSLGAGEVEDTALPSTDETPHGGDLGDVVLVVVNLDPHAVRESTVRLDLPALGLDWADRLRVDDLTTGATYEWGQANYVRLDPFVQPAHVFTVRRAGQ